nr:MAG TPA: hypothetical protein [Caudoviricetes sp.]
MNQDAIFIFDKTSHNFFDLQAGSLPDQLRVIDRQTGKEVCEIKFISDWAECIIGNTERTFMFTTVDETYKAFRVIAVSQPHSEPAKYIYRAAKNAK